MPTPFSKTRKLLFILLVSLCCSCFQKRHDKVIITLRDLDASIVMSNAVLEDNNKMMMESMEEARGYPAAKEKFALWQPKAKIIRYTSTNLVSFIESLKTELKNAAGLTIENGSEKFRRDNMDAPSRLFIYLEKGSEFYDSLKKYDRRIPLIDDRMYAELKYKLIPVTYPYDINNGTAEEFIKAVFGDVPAQSAVAILSRFQNSILLNEKMMLDYCLAKTDWHPHSDIFYLIANINSSSVKLGEEIRINAGLGTFSSATRPQITINGKKVPVESYGLTEYTIKTPNKPGEYQIDILCDFTDEEGITKTLERLIRYKVSE